VIDGIVAGIIIGVLAMIAGRVGLTLPWRRALGRCMAVAALGLATAAERLTDVEPAPLNLKRLPGPATQDIALWDGQDWQLIELSLN